MSASTAAGSGKGPRGGRTECLLVVGMGASAGGIEALQQFLSLAPASSGIAYVLVQHMAPDHESLLAHFLGRRTVMPVHIAEQGVAPRPDHVYVISPATVLGLVDGVFRVTPAEQGQRGQVDAFLRSLAIDRCERAVGILLSGMGSDGTEGLRAIREHGGLSLAQAPDTAKYESMPRSAIDAGVVDEVLLVDAMPAKLLERTRAVEEGRGRVVAPFPAWQPERPSAAAGRLLDAIDRICGILQRSTGHDFSRHKHGTVLRRLRQRLEAPGAPPLDEYVGLLRRDSGAAKLLAKELLLGVTEFFRDPEVFEYLGLHVLPEILATRHGAEDAVRIWVPGCGSGEEAYSLGMLVRERLQTLGRRPPPRVRIIATDADGEAIAQARRGRYSAYAVQRVPPERRRRFFTQDGNTYQIARDIREMCVFSQHSVVRDPPFLHLDLVSCRNVLASLDAELQGRTVSVFHYALRAGGYLFLGPSESLGRTELFATVDDRFRVFRRTELETRPPLALPLVIPQAPQTEPGPPHPTPERTASAALERLLQEYAASGAVVSKSGKVICMAGAARKYLKPRAGVESVLETAHPHLGLALRTGLRTAARSGRNVVRDGVRVDLGGSTRLLRVTVRKLPGAKRRGQFAVILEERGEGFEDESRRPRKPEAAGMKGGALFKRLERELRATRADLRTMVDDLQSAKAEIGSSKQGMSTTNTELLAANERLQSSEEELRTVNDELATVNARLAQKVDELSQANSDLSNLFSSTDIATLFVDREQRVARFTPAAKVLFRLIDGDVGRPIRHLASRFGEHDLAADIEQVLRTLQPIERQVETVDRDAWYQLRIVPYRTSEDVMAGAVVTLADVTQIKRAEAGLRRLATVVIDSNDAVTVVDLDGRILEWNSGAERAYGYSADEAKRMSIDALVPEEDRARVREQLAAVRRGGDVEGGEVRRVAKDGRTLDVALTMTRLEDDRGRPIAVATTERDITKRKQREAERERLLGELRADLDSTAALLRIGSLFLQDGNVAAVLGDVVESAIAVSGADFGNIQLLDPTSGDLRIAAQKGFPDWWVEFWDEAGKGQGACGTALERRERVLVEDVELSPIFHGPHLEAQRKAGVRAVQSTPIVGRAGEPLGMLSTHTKTVGVPSTRALRGLDLLARQAADILERARAEAAAGASEERFRAIVEASSEVLYRMSPDWTEMRQLDSRGFLANTEVASRTWLSDYIPADEQARVLAAIHTAIRRKGVFELEHRVLRADGTVGWTLSRAIPLRDASGAIVEWFGAASDVTERKRTEAAAPKGPGRRRGYAWRRRPGEPPPTR